MKYTAFYVVRANQALASRLRLLGLDRLDDLLDPQLWTNEQGGRTVYGFDDYSRAMKRLFLAHLKLVVLDPHDIADIFGDLTTTEGSFDRWWTLETFQGPDADAADVLDDLQKAGHTTALGEVGRPLVDQPLHRSTDDCKGE